MDILAQRSSSYGDGNENLTRISQLWSGYLGIHVSVHDVAWLMVLLKASRSRQDPSNDDNYIDGIGYLRLAERFK